MGWIVRASDRVNKISILQNSWLRTAEGEELNEAILDIEVAMNNRPLCYLEEDVQFPTLTPNTMLFLYTNILPELKPYQLEERDLRKRAKFLQKTKDAMWNRWRAEYLRALGANHRLKHGDKKCSLAIEDVVIVASSERNIETAGCLE